MASGWPTAGPDAIRDDPGPTLRRGRQTPCVGSGQVTRVDWIALAIAAIAALYGLKRGLIATGLSLAGVAAGAVLGARTAPHFLHGGSHSPYTPLAGLIGALVGAAILQAVAGLAGSVVRGSISVIPPLRALDS